MEFKEYKTMYYIENDYWWYAGLRQLVFSYIENNYKTDERLKILDAGCGTGEILEKFNAHRAYGVDFSEETLKCSTI